MCPSVFVCVCVCLRVCVPACACGVQIKDLTTQLTTAQDAVGNVRLEWQLDQSQRESALKECEFKRNQGVKEIKRLSAESATLTRQVKSLSAAKIELEASGGKAAKQVRSSFHVCSCDLDCVRDLL